MGRGLDALFSSEKIESRITPMSELTHVALDKITPNPTQPRSTFDEQPLESLAESIKELGLIQPITLQRVEGGRYTIISGERRWRASQMAGVESIPAYIREVEDEAIHVMALVENLQREDLNPIEIALGLQRLIDECNLTQEGLATRLSMKRSSISNYLRLLRLSDEVQYALKSGIITMGHAKAIAAVESEERRIEILRACIERGISVREAEAMAQQSAKPAKKESRPQTAPAEFEPITEQLGAIFSRGVEIRSNSRGGGRIVINFANRDEVMRLLAKIEKE